MAWRRGLVAATLALPTLAVGACEDRRASAPPSATAGPEAYSRGNPACRPARATKLGQPFLRVCPARGATAAEAPFWIHAAPIPCTAGDHDEVACPPAVPLRVEESRGAPTRFSPMLAAMTDSLVAHQLCAMRFAGRLPTRSERARAGAAAGLTTLAVVESTGASGAHADYRVLPEWTTETVCEQPSVLGPQCGARTAPAEATARLDWAGLRSCDAELTNPDAIPVVVAGESCPLGGLGATSPEGPLPCAVGITAERGGLPARFGFSLRCHAQTGRLPERREDRTAEIAAVRCVVAEALLDGRVEQG